MSPGRSCFYLLICCVLLVGFGIIACGTEQAEAPAGPSNVVVILVDTLRADHLGHHGYPRPTSPTIDALAEKSVVFMRHSAQASRTGPSVASLLTGLHPRSHGVVNPLTHFDAKGTLDESQMTLAEILSNTGYQCAGFATNTNISRKLGFSQGFDHYELLRWKPADELNAALFRWLDARESTPRADDPLCLYLHYVDPHSPYETPDAFAQPFVDPEYSGKVKGRHRQLDRVVAGSVTFDEADAKQLVALYDAEIRFFDAQLAILLEDLEARGLLEDALVVFVSDHGEELFEHGSLLHGYTLYEEQLRIPLLIRHPSLEPTRVESLSRQIDVLPTLLDVLGIPHPPGIQGESLLAKIEGAGVDRPVYAEASLRAMKTVQLESFADGDWKWIETTVPEASEQLFNLTEDAGEQNDLRDARPEVADRMRAAMRAYRDALPIGESTTVELTPAEMDELRALGYLPEK
jgi:choline-sulfatase